MTPSEIPSNRLFPEFCSAVQNHWSTTGPIPSLAAVSFRSRRLFGNREAVVSTVQNHAHATSAEAFARAVADGLEGPLERPLTCWAEGGVRGPLAGHRSRASLHATVQRGDVVGLAQEEGPDIGTASGFVLIEGKPYLLLPRWNYGQDTLAGQNAYRLDPRGSSPIGVFSALSDSPGARRVNAALVEVDPSLLPDPLNADITEIDEDPRRHPLKPLGHAILAQSLGRNKDATVTGARQFRGDGSGFVEGLCSLLDPVPGLEAVDGECMWLVERRNKSEAGWGFGDGGTLFVSTRRRGKKALGVMVLALTQELAAVMPLARILDALGADFPTSR